MSGQGWLGPVLCTDMWVKKSVCGGVFDLAVEQPQLFRKLPQNKQKKHDTFHGIEIDLSFHDFMLLNMLWLSRHYLNTRQMCWYINDIYANNTMFLCRWLQSMTTETAWDVCRIMTPSLSPRRSLGTCLPSSLSTPPSSSIFQVHLLTVSLIHQLSYRIKKYVFWLFSKVYICNLLIWLISK